jgi:hypothetical protein
MMQTAIFIAFLVVIFPLALAMMRANELFLLRVSEGKVTVRRGKLPQRLLDDIDDVMQTVPSGTVRCVNEGGRPRAFADGAITPAQAQRLRNVIGEWSTAQIRHAPPPRRRG